MKSKEDIFLFIAKKLEGVGQPKDDSAGSTIYGITRKYYPQSYAVLKDLMLSKAPQNEIDDAIVDTYTRIWNRCGAKLMRGNLAYFYFDYYFNSPKAAVTAIQQVIKNCCNTMINVDGILGKQTKEMIEDSFHPISAIGDICWLNFYRRQHYYTIRKKWRCGLMNRVWKLENFIYGGGQ